MLHDSNRPSRLQFYPSLGPEMTVGTDRSHRACSLPATVGSPTARLSSLQLSIPDKETIPHRRCNTRACGGLERRHATIVHRHSGQARLCERTRPSRCPSGWSLTHAHRAKALVRHRMAGTYALCAPGLRSDGPVSTAATRRVVAIASQKPRKRDRHGGGLSLASSGQNLRWFGRTPCGGL